MIAAAAGAPHGRPVGRAGGEGVERTGELRVLRRLSRLDTRSSTDPDRRTGDLQHVEREVDHALGSEARQRHMRACRLRREAHGPEDGVDDARAEAGTRAGGAGPTGSGRRYLEHARVRTVRGARAGGHLACRPARAGCRNPRDRYIPRTASGPLQTLFVSPVFGAVLRFSIVTEAGKPVSPTVTVVGNVSEVPAPIAGLSRRRQDCEADEPRRGDEGAPPRDCAVASRTSVQSWFEIGMTPISAAPGCT